MDAEEICAMVWDELACAGTALCVSQIASASGVDDLEVARALGKLRALRLVEITAALPQPLYTASTRLDSMRWARALEVGVLLSSLERHASISTSQKAQALKVASDGTLDRVRKKEQNAKHRAKVAVLAGRAATRVASSEVARLHEDSRRALESPGLDPAARAILEAALEQSSRAMEQIKESLMKDGRR